jgi:hypothetical protein
MISNTTLPHGREWGIFWNDLRESAVFSPCIYGGNLGSRPAEGNAEGAKLPCRYVLRKDPEYVHKRESLGGDDVSPFRVAASP